MAAILKTLTLGCKVNQYETEFVREGLLASGFSDPLDGEAADLCIVNTCTVTNEGDSKSRQAIRKLARENPDARIVVMGCYATRAPDEVAQLPGVVEVVTDKRELPDLLGRFGVVNIPTGISRFGDRHRAYVKVQDGCLLRCSYCIIPSVRPQLRSRRPGEILEEVARLADNGYREIVLTGIHLGHYGVDWNADRPKSEWTRLADLLSAMMRIDKEFRVRLSSIEATEITRELIGVLAEYQDRICPHLHICLQSGSDRTLRRMRRRWGTRQFLHCCSTLRERLDEPAFTTDVIVGFPGETDSDFQQTCSVVKEIGFSKVHIFPYSPRKGTPAADLPDQVPGTIKGERVSQLAEIEARSRQDFFERLVGRTLRVLVESPHRRQPGKWQGTSCRYAPVDLPAPADASGTLVDVVPTSVVAGCLVV